MNNISISFIIPYYKVEISLLHRCLQSLLEFDSIGLDWEAWIIDDGTPDSEASDIKTIFTSNRIHYHYKAHEGLGIARNTGIELATKEYIHFLDADDYLYFETAQEVLNILSCHIPELITFNLRKEYDHAIKHNHDKPKGITWRGTGVDYMLSHNLHGSAAGYFIKKSALGEHRFSNIAYHEDEEFTPLLFLQLNDVIITEIEAYAYYQRSGSLLHEQKKEQLTARYDALLSVLKRLRNHANSLTTNASKALNRRVDMLCMAMLYTLIQNSPDKKFLLANLTKMKEDGFYPLPQNNHTLIYLLFRTVTHSKYMLLWLNFLYRRIHKQ